MKVKKWYDFKPKQGVALSFLRSLYDLSAEMRQILTLLKDNPDLDIKPQITAWGDKLDPKLIKQSIQEVRYASRERLQISRGETKKIEGSKTKTKTVTKKKKEE